MAKRTTVTAEEFNAAIQTLKTSIDCLKVDLNVLKSKKASSPAVDVSSELANAISALTTRVEEVRKRANFAASFEADVKTMQMRTLDAQTKLAAQKVQLDGLELRVDELVSDKGEPLVELQAIEEQLGLLVKAGELDIERDKVMQTVLTSLNEDLYKHETQTANRLAVLETNNTQLAQLKDQLATQQWLSTRLSALSDQAPDVLKIPSADPLNNFSELALEGRLMVYGAYTTMFLLWGLLVSAYLFFK